MDEHSSRRIVTNTLKQPTRVQRGQRHTDTYLVLLRVEFTLLHVVTNGTVRSYRTLSPLPFTRRSALCCTGRRLTPPGRYPALCPV